MAEIEFMFAVTAGFIIGLAALLFGVRARRVIKSASPPVTSQSG